jgi:acyl-coenzyme A thioesterase PaaI-like protein
VPGRIPPHHDPACWGCGDNPTGLRLPLPRTEGQERYEARFSFDERHQGGPGIAHGGLVSAALDEACGLLATWYRFPAVTGRIFVRYRRPAPINAPLTLAAWIEDARGRRLDVRGELRRDDDDGGELLAEARTMLLHVPLEHFLATPEGREAGRSWERRLAARDSEGSARREAT